MRHKQSEFRVTHTGYKVQRMVIDLRPRRTWYQKLLEWLESRF